MMKKISSIDFFPHDPTSLLINQDMKLKILKLSLFFANQCIDAINSFFIKKTYSDFDAHVGDTLCQIRAYKLLLMIEYFKENPAERFYVEELNRLNFAKQKIEEKIQFFDNLVKNKQAKYNKVLDNKEILYTFLSMHNILFEITETTFYLTQSSVLTKYSHRISFGVSINMKVEQLAKNMSVGQTTARKLIKNFQLTLAELSCEFVHSLCKKLLGQSQLNKILPQLETTDSHKRKVFPAYEVTKIILLHMKITQTPVLFVTHKQKNHTTESPNSFAFIFSKEKNEFELCSSTQFIPLETPCFIIHGSTLSNSINSIINIGLTTVVLSNMATHPQLRTETMNEREKELTSMELLAESLGYCKKNPKLFFLKHIYADSLINELTRLDFYNHSESYSLSTQTHSNILESS